LYRDRATGFVQYILVTSPALYAAHPRADVRRYPSQPDALESLSRIGRPAILGNPWRVTGRRARGAPQRQEIFWALCWRRVVIVCHVFSDPLHLRSGLVPDAELREACDLGFLGSADGDVDRHHLSEALREERAAERLDEARWVHSVEGLEVVAV
jgi:hypothetical protein